MRLSSFFASLSGAVLVSLAGCNAPVAPFPSPDSPAVEEPQALPSLPGELPGEIVTMPPASTTGLSPRRAAARQREIEAAELIYRHASACKAAARHFLSGLASLPPNQDPEIALTGRLAATVDVAADRLIAEHAPKLGMTPAVIDKNNRRLLDNMSRNPAFAYGATFATMVQNCPDLTDPGDMQELKNRVDNYAPSSSPGSSPHQPAAPSSEPRLG